MSESEISIAIEPIQSLLNKGSIKSYFFNVVYEVQELCSELERTHERIKEVAANNLQVGSWLTQLIKIAYEAEDVVVTYVSEIESSKNLLIQMSRAYNTRKKLSKIRLKIRIVKIELQKLGTANSQIETSVEVKTPQPCLSVDGQFVVGIQKDVERLAAMLIAPVEGDALREEARLEVLAIVGMGGSGKTTLARNIFNHQKVRSYFTYHVWISLSQGWTTSEVLSEISKLLREKNLITETKVVIASRNDKQPSNTSFKWSFYEVQLLNEQDGWELFNKVFKSSHNGAVLEEQYHDAAKKNLNNCQSLASAIVELGSLFEIKDSNGREMAQSQIMRNPNYIYLPKSNDILALSYHHLPYYLKPCFLYFGLFPKGSIIAAGRLMRLWIAEGFVKCRNNETLEEAARRLLQELIEHSVVQVVKRTYARQPKSIQVHNMMTDLCVKEAQKLDFLYSSESSNQTAKNVSRRAAIINLSKGLSLTLPVENSHLRSLLIFGQGVDQHGNIGNLRIDLNLAVVFKIFKLLRVLDMCGIKTSDGVLPKDIGNLVHLRYLRIRSTNIWTLPDTIGNLRELITFVYRNVKVSNDGIILPDVFWKLNNLRHLYLPLEKINRTNNFTLNTLKNLQTLWGVRAGRWMVSEMQNINPNLNKLCIQGIADNRQIVDTLFNCPIIQTHDQIRSLALEWYGFSLEGLGPLCSKKNLLKLRLKGNALDMPTSLKFPSSLQKIELYYTQLNNPESMAALGQLPCLKFLILAKDSYVGSEWIIEGQDIFPQLQVLEMSDLPVLEKWDVSKGAIPCLKRLSVESCPRLKQIPEELRSNPTLEITARLEKNKSEASSSRGKQF